jgi:aspartate ammonia-lyase
MGAPRKYIFAVTQTLRALTGFGFARAENLLECTQNADVFVEVSGILKAHATTLKKIVEDLRIMSSGPEAGLREIGLPARQAGSSIMPGKVNPVIPESVAQVAMQVMGNDAVVANAVAGGNLELCQYLPLVAENLLSSLEMLVNANRQLAQKCVVGIVANEDACGANVRGTTGIVTVLVSRVGYARMSALVDTAVRSKRPVVDVIVDEGVVTRDELEQLLTPESVCKLGD